ncbi:molybdopterin molybdotransferase MoeA [Gramella jeungdoensis]|uniref:Molybdopterin molybdenumtransferase n=1 Tax=Gramella jeungdoensis TaxID=708091 RepID=A0ABT0Z0K1_9FLAO|nr:molybdopterin molybdotransferase MoeA [Gramella jeungdoensis]MCM8569258.1 molybdopterin molybdotransferase MoeA [Gramella jeungdoensis]
MISYTEAHKKVIETAMDFGETQVHIMDSIGCVLAEDILADRDFPPFNRSTKDGIAVNSKYIKENDSLKIEGICAAGDPQKELKDFANCLEIMTGAVLPDNCDAVIMYEEVDIENGKARISSSPIPGQNIHKKGSDQQKDEVLLKKGEPISSQNIGVLATVGKERISVKKLPKVAIISTGNELVPIDKVPEIHQIRTSNSYSLQALLRQLNIESELMHIPDEKDILEKRILTALKNFDVLVLSGGVSKGKYDYLPEIFEKLSVQKKFHRVAQQPGKPFWFGMHRDYETHIFAFPGNPVSTYVNFHIYFNDWLDACMSASSKNYEIRMNDEVENSTDLTKFLLVSANHEKAVLTGNLVNGNGSGDLVSLSKASGVIKVEPQSAFKTGSAFSYVPFR